MSAKRVGVILNPIAGFGGVRAMHGTDALPASRFAEAVAAGRAEKRLLRAVRRLLELAPATTLVAAHGLLGSEPLGAAGIAHEALAGHTGVSTTRNDTRAAARKFLAERVDCILFVGGDGTAVDVAEAVGGAVPVLGVPAGVKMHSGVFAISPESAGALLARYVSGACGSEEVEVCDVGSGDELGQVATVRSPQDHRLRQRAKAPSAPVDVAGDRVALARDVLASAPSGATWVLGPGITVAAVAEALGVAGTLRGVDVRHADGRVECDVDEARVFEIAQSVQPIVLVLGIIGGQGFLLGRGNHEISSRVVDRIDASNVRIVATPDKLGSLYAPKLLVDVGDDSVQHPLAGYRQVMTGAGRSVVMRVVNAASHGAASPLPHRSLRSAAHDPRRGPRRTSDRNTEGTTR